MPPLRRRVERLVLALLLGFLLAATGARADNAKIPGPPPELALRGGLDSGYQLQVFINGFDSKQVVTFERNPAGRWSAKRGDLAGLGLKAGLGSADAKITLDQIPGVASRYDEDAQTLSLTVPQTSLAPKTYSARTERTQGPVASDWGASLNYDIFGGSTPWWLGKRVGFGSGSATLDVRAFSPLGMVEQTGVLGTTAFTKETALRLDTTWRYDDGENTTYRGGDVVGSGLPWTRPIRIGGVQMSHDFGLRPDLVTGPSATVSGTAAVPSTADVYVNNMKLYSQPVDAGPFRIENLPAINGAGSATLVLHDVTGKEVTESAPFLASSRLLRPGVFDYSAEAGYARLNYGVTSFDYDRHPIAAASLRAGVTDLLTLEGHAEGGHGLYNGGVGATVSVFQRAVVELSVAGSDYEGRLGAQIGLGGSVTIYGASLDASFQRALRNYADLAEVTTPRVAPNSILSNLSNASVSNPLFSSLLLSTSVAPPRALDRISLSVPRVFEEISGSVSFLNQVQGDGTRSRIASLGLTRNFRNGVSAFATVFADFSQKKPDYGFLLGLSYTFNNGVSASTTSSLQQGGFAQATQINKSAGQQTGDYGYELDDQEGANRYARASGTYQSAFGRATVSVNQYGQGRQSLANGTGEFSGSLAWLGGGLGLSPRISDSFAMVDAGAPGVTVLEDNQPIGKTDASGHLLAPNLRSFQDNKIALDPTTLPLNASVGVTEIILRPRANSGLFANFRVRTDAHDAEIVLVDEKGQPLPTGSQIETPGGAAATVGYDGRAYLTDLKPHNALKVAANGRACVVDFDFQPPRGPAHSTLGPFVCRGEGASEAAAK